MSQQGLAKAVGVSQVSISDIERGVVESPSHDTVVRLARALGVEPSELFPVADVPTSCEPAVPAAVDPLIDSLDREVV
jgi:transcriptional regulator with XRE-family HTH domain